MQLQSLLSHTGFELGLRLLGILAFALLIGGLLWAIIRKSDIPIGVD